MTSLKSLFQSECGEINPLIRLTEHYKHDKTLVIQDGIINSPLSTINSTNSNSNISANTIVDELVNEYYSPSLAPNTFQFQGLLTSLSLSDKNECEWAQQFLHPYFNSTSMNSTITEPIPIAFEYEQNYISSPSSPILYPHAIFPDQQLFLTNTEFDNDTVNATNDILSFLGENQFAVKTEDDTIVENLSNMTPAIDTNEPEMTDEIVSRNGKQADDCTTGAENSHIESNQTQHLHSFYEQSNNRISQYNEYKFIEQNLFLDFINPYDEGLSRLKIHDTTNAILCFEAAVQKDSKHIDAWFQLGITQHTNEQDNRAIYALKKCVELDSKNLQAYLTLAVCYTNEMLKSKAIDSLYKWLVNHDKYSHLLSNHSLQTINSNKLTFDNLKNIFLQAISSSNSSNDIDSDLQACLGILFYLYEDYAKAAECFNIAVLTKPKDALLWNKLGASIANSGHNEQAVHAYYQALTLSPGFVRARYNLGISCLNLNAYQQAIEHFLIALKQQTNMSMSESIWHTLSIAIVRFERKDLNDDVACKNLSSLLREFEIE